MPATNTCQYQDCDQSIRRDHYLCRDHYYEEQGGVISTCSGCGQVYKPDQHDVCRNCYGNRSLRQPQQIRDWPRPYREVSHIPPELDRLLNGINQVRWTIRNNPTEINDSERATEQHCVMPILLGLGWDIHTPGEVVPQYRISQGRGRSSRKVDFALCLSNQPTVLIEVKRHGVEYDPSWEQQLREYTDHLTSGFGILTNGQKWLVYVVEQGNARHISTLDIVEEPLDALVGFQQLSKDILISSSITQTRTTGSQTGWPTLEGGRPEPMPRLRPPSDDEILERLNNYRAKESSRRKLAPYMIFNNGTLSNIVSSRPRNIQHLSQVSGVGVITIERYGDAIIKIVNHPVRQ